MSAESTDCNYHIKSGPGEFKQWATVVQKKEHKGKKKDCKCVCEEEGCDLIPLWIITRGRKSVSPIFMILKIKVCQSNVSWATTKAESTWLGLYMLWKMTQLFSSVGADNMMGQEQELTLSWKDIHYSYYSALSWKTINEYE